MKLQYIFLAILSVQIAAAQKQEQRLQIFDLSQQQLRLLNKHRNTDSAIRSKVFSDSVFKPHQKFWEGYVGPEPAFLRWMNREGITYLDFLNKRNQAINGEELFLQFNKVKQEMQKLTGYQPAGKWYIIFCHGATNLGSLGSGEMLIDLSHEDNATMENIINYFPHELTHQIMSNINKNKDSTALGTIIGEGFAVYMNQLYWGKKYSLAQNLGYTEQELEQCKAQHEIINRFFKENGYSAEDTTINKFRARYYKINAQLPGAIGYYIGYKVISAYVKKYGKNSWKDVFLKSPGEIYKLSNY